jgi:nicotinate phosphoribosyltransferase
MTPDPTAIPAWTDKYFLKTKEAVRRFGDRTVTYALFMRRPVISAPRLAIDWLKEVAASRHADFQIALSQASSIRALRVALSSDASTYSV